MPSSSASRSEQDSVVRTYFGLRIAMVLLVVLLFAAVIVQIVGGTPGCVQTSLSAYYYTPVRPVFVATLSALGVCLILYRGSTDLENVLLNFSGFLSIVVAFVPVRFEVACDTTNVPTPAEIVLASRGNVLALFVVGLLALGAGLVVGRGRGGRSPIATAAGVVTTLALVAGLVVFSLAPGLFQDYGHGTAAIALFVGFVLVVVVDARHTDRRAYAVAYTVIAVAMPVAGLVAGLLGGAYRVLLIETVLITLFAVYWAIQTYELRDVGLRSAPSGGSRLGRFWATGA